ncbi:MAG: MFS transporter [Candidatus Asgardarchaeia archaeon]
MNENNDNETATLSTELKKVYLATSLSGFSTGLYVPFVGIYAAELGFTYGEMGLLRSVGNVAPNLFQPLFGYLSDRFAKRKTFVIIGYFFSSILIPLFLFARLPIDLIFLYGIQSIAASIAIPAWNALLSELIPEKLRGTILGKIGALLSIWSMISTVVSGVIMTFIAFDSVKATYTIPFYLSAVTGILSACIVIFLKEPKRNINSKRTPKLLLRIIRDNNYFSRLLLASVIFSFGMSLIWPYFPIIFVRIIHASKLEISLQSALQSIIIIVLQPYFGKLADKVGRTPLIKISRFFFPAVPILLLLAKDMTLIYVISIIAGFGFAISSSPLIAYIFDIAPNEEQASYIAMYNVVTGIIFFTGSLVGGYLGEYLKPFYGELWAMYLVLIISALLRIVGSFIYLTLKEPKEYRTTLKAELVTQLRSLKQLLRI